MSRNKGIIYVLLGAASFGFTPIFVELGFRYGFSSGQLTIAQMIISFLFLWGIVLIIRPSFKEFTCR